MARLQAAIRGIGALLAAAIAVAAIGGYLWYDAYRLGQRQDAARDCLAVAPAAAAALFSYDYRTFDQSVANGRTFAAGGFADEYGKTATALKATAVQQQAVVTAQATLAGVISADGDHVDVLLYVDQYRRNVNIQGEKVDQNRVVLTMKRVDGQWKVTGAAAI